MAFIRNNQRPSYHQILTQAIRTPPIMNTSVNVGVRTTITAATPTIRITIATDRGINEVIVLLTTVTSEVSRFINSPE